MVDIDRLAAICREAGAATLQLYASNFAVEAKADGSPVTLADKASHERIVRELRKAYPDLPVLSEEGAQTPYEVRRHWRRFWLVDPLDGTKEFVKRNGEFTVNIALVEDGFPVFGMIYAPAADVLYYGSARIGAFKAAGGGAPVAIRAADWPALEKVVLAVSRSHPSPEADAYAQLLRPRRAERIERGSSLKLCAVAEGSAHAYPRFGPTMEWDTAAGQAIVEAAGGVVLTPGGERLRCNKERLTNEPFIAACSPELVMHPRPAGSESD